MAGVQQSRLLGAESAADGTKTASVITSSGILSCAAAAPEVRAIDRHLLHGFEQRQPPADADGDDQRGGAQVAQVRVTRRVVMNTLEQTRSRIVWAIDRSIAR